MRSPPPSPSARWILAAGVALLAVGWEGRAPRADTSPVVARVGDVTITAAELERRIGALPPFQLKTFGSTPAIQRRAFLERVMVRDALLAQGGAEHGIADREDIRERSRAVLRNEMLAHLRSEVAHSNPVDDAAVKAYYEKNASKFRSPERRALWIIATRTEAEAVEVLAELKKDSSPKHWGELARAKSIDGFTAMRGGNLGFVSPDGTTPEPGVKVSSTILDAVDKLKDGDVTLEPIHDHDRWAVVWRRQTMKSVERPVELEAGSIKQMLLHTRTDAKIKETMARLREEHLTEHNPDLLDLIEVSAQGELTPVRRPGSIPPAKRSIAAPVPVPAGLR